MSDEARNAGITRKAFLTGTMAVASGAMAQAPLRVSGNSATVKRPRAITMWDFSWLERRWPGAGYENWDRALDELADRGYNAVRIDAYPHLVAIDPKRAWLLKPEWSVQDWGSPSLTRVQVVPALYEFMTKCRDRGIKVGLSTWHREDADNLRMKIKGPEHLAENWDRTLDGIKQAGLMDSILYVDLNNEFPGPAWAPFLKPNLGYNDWHLPQAQEFMNKAMAELRRTYGDLPFLFSILPPMEKLSKATVGNFDAVDFHFWMAQANAGEFYKLAGYKYDRFSMDSYHNMQLKGEATYRARPNHWRKLMLDGIAAIADGGQRSGKPLITTESWAVVDYKDAPLLDWGWVKDLTAEGTLAAARTGRWHAICTSNFCGPQFHGMWRDVAWHQALTKAIKSAPIAADIRHGKLWDRL